MVHILEGVFKGLIQWLFLLLAEIVEYLANVLLGVFSMDLNYFEEVMPITKDIVDVVIVSGWALLIGNLVFQAIKSMMSGLGFEGEEPKTLFARTFVFAFLLMGSRQVCEIGLGVTGRIIELLQIPSSVTLNYPPETTFDIGASWLLTSIIGTVLMWQIVKLFFEIGERYFLVGFLTIIAPWAIAMGGSKNTADIFKGWARMFGSMCIMMAMNVIFLKMILSAMSHMPSGVESLLWVILVVAVARVARKIDGLISRIGLNPAITGDGLGHGFPGMLSFAIIKSIASNAARTIGGNAAGTKGTSGGSTRKSGGTSRSNGKNTSFSQGGINNRNRTQNSSKIQNQNNTAQQNQTNQSGTAGTANPSMAAQPPVIANKPGMAGTPPTGSVVQTSTANNQLGTAGTDPMTNTDKSSAINGKSGTAGTTHIGKNPSAQQNSATVMQQGNSVQSQTNVNRQQTTSTQNSSRRSSVTQNNPAGSRTLRPTIPSMAGNIKKISSTGQNNGSTVHPPITRYTKSEPITATGTAETGNMAGTAKQRGETLRPTRYSTIPSNPHSPVIIGDTEKTVNTRGMAGMSNEKDSVSYNAPGTAGRTSRYKDLPPDKLLATGSHSLTAPHNTVNTTSVANNRSNAVPQRDGGNTGRSSPAASPSAATPASGNTLSPARQEFGRGITREAKRNSESSRITRQTSSGTAGIGENLVNRSIPKAKPYSHSGKHQNIEQRQKTKNRKTFGNIRNKPKGGDGK